MHLKARHLPVFSLLFAFSFIPTARAQQPSACSLPRFSQDVAALQTVAADAKAKPGTDTVVLCDEDSYVFDADGKSVHTNYSLYKILTQNGAENWDELSVRWEPWHDEKPTVHARVISADGTIHNLDLKTLKDESATDEQAKIYSDGHVLRGPLPAIAVGAIVEQETVTSETEAFFAAGTVDRVFFGENVPTLETRLLLDAPSLLKLNFETQLLPDLKTERTENAGRTRVCFTQGPLSPLDPAPSYLPAEIPARPAVTFATGTDWGSIASKYAEIVDAQIANADLKSVVSRLTQGKSTREEKAAALLEFVSSHIRYTGVEFGESAIVPHPAEQTLKHEYGDCKDKSSLIVAMLRAAGVPAYVALLNAGSRQDIPANLAGIGLFDHAIVFLPGEPEIWIDATDDYARVGQLPSADQGRFALIARKETTSLTRTPESSSKENTVAETREFYLAENGPARVVETTQPHGVYESEFRSAYADPDSKAIKKNLTDYVSDVYLADRLVRSERSNPKDLSKQFQLQIEAGKARRGFTELESADAAIRLEWLFNRLPSELQERPKAEKKESLPDDSDAGPEKPRTQDYLLPSAFVSEWKYKIVPPIGFQAKKLPPDRKVQVGPAVYEQHFNLGKEGGVEGVLRFDTVKRRLTAAEMEALRNGVVALREEEPIFVQFELTAAALRNQGKMRESLQSTRALIALHPAESVHHLQMAQGLLRAGLGQAAREEARQAVKLEPPSALAQKTLAEILEYDALGRKFRLGTDYAGAVEAFRAAAKLDPDDHAPQGNLAILLEYNKDGERYAAGAPLKDAIREYQALKPEQLRDLGLANNLPYALFYAGEFAEARKSAETLNPQPNVIIVATEAALNGSAAAIIEARKRVTKDDDQKQLLKNAGEILMRVRIYSPAADLLEAGASGNDASRTLGLATILRKVTPHEKLVLPDTPDGLTRKIILIELEGNSPDFLIPYLSRNAKKVYDNTDTEQRETAARDIEKLHRSFIKSGIPSDAVVDLTYQLMDIKVEGNDQIGYRASMRGGDKLESFYIVKEDGKYRLLDTSQKPNSIGLEILDRVGAGDVAGARVLLDWVRDDQHLPGGDDALAGFAFPRIWTKGKEGDLRQMKLAAAALLAQTKQTAGEGLRLLQALQADVRDDAEKLNISLALLDGYAVLSKYEKANELASALAKEHPDSKRLFLDQVFSLRKLGRYADADRLATNWMAKQPDDLTGSRALMVNAVQRENYGLARTLAKNILESSRAEAGDYNSAAWYGLFTGRPEDLDIASATKSLQMSQNNAGTLHTLGCLYAAAGKTAEAREVLLQAMELLNMEEPDSNYWYGFGRIAEQYGELISAKERLREGDSAQ